MHRPPALPPTPPDIGGAAAAATAALDDDLAAGVAGAGGGAGGEGGRAWAAEAAALLPKAPSSLEGAAGAPGLLGARGGSSSSGRRPWAKARSPLLVAATLGVAAAVCVLSRRSSGGLQRLAARGAGQEPDFAAIEQLSSASRGHGHAGGASVGRAATHVRELENRPRGDRRKYQYAVLANGLEVLNIQDSRTLRTAAAVAVQAGSFNDPVHLPGLAHFCEHMLFLGTKRYPEPSGFDDFMSKHGGFSNAYTANEVTVYYGEVAQAAGGEEVKRLADFFRAPLFMNKFARKEVRAINSEHLKNVQNPDRRILETLNSLADEGSPVSRFHTGNLETLFNKPRRRGINPVNALKHYFRNHYCPSRMRLVTFSSQPLHEQLLRAEHTLGTIPKGGEACRRKVETFESPEPFPKKRMGKYVVIEGTELQPSLWVHWQCKDLTQAYETQPLEYVFHVLGYDGVGSFSRMLQDSVGLASSVGMFQDMSSAGTSLYMIIKLTDLGRQNVELVLDILYAYIATLRRRGVDRELYHTIAAVRRLEWDWNEPSGPSDTAADFAERMTRLPPAHLLTGDMLIEHPSVKLVEYILSKLSPDNMNLALVDQGARHTGLLKDYKVKSLPHWGVKYGVSELFTVMPGAAKRWDKWLNSSNATWLHGRLSRAMDDAKVQAVGTQFPDPPGPIKDVPKDLSLVNMQVKKFKPSSPVDLFGPAPRLIPFGPVAPPAESREPQVWYRSGWVTQSPKVTVQVMFRPKRREDEPETTAIDVVRLGMYRKLLLEEIAPSMVDLTMTGVGYSIGVSSLSGLTFEFTGFAPVLPRLVATVLDQFNRFNSNLTLTRPERFARVSQELRQHLGSYTSMPVHYALLDRNILLERGSHSQKDMLAALGNVTRQSAAASAGELLLARPLQFTALGMGNFGEAKAHSIIHSVSSGIHLPSWLSVDHHGHGKVQYIDQIVKPERPIEVRALNPRDNDPNGVTVVSLINGVSTIESQVTYGMLGQILSTVAYNELRTARQLGYVVQAGYGLMSNVDYVSTIVQGEVLDADEMESAIEMVLTKLMPKKLQELTQEEFKSYKDSMIQDMQEPPMSPYEEVSHFWYPVKLDGHCFEYREEVMKYLKSPLVTRESLSDAWAQLMLPKKGLRRKIAIKYFVDKVPPRPSLEEANRSWAKQGVAEHALSLLAHEHKKAMLLDRVDTAMRQKIATEGGYFPKDIECRLRDATVEALALEPDKMPRVNTSTTEAPASRTPGGHPASRRPLLAALGQRASEVAKQMDAQDVAVTLDAYATLGEEPSREMLSALGQRVEEVASDMGPQDVADTLNAYGRLGKRPAGTLLAKVGDRIIKVASRLNARNVSSVINAFAALAWQPSDELLAVVGKRAEQVAPHMSSEDVALVLIAYAKLWRQHEADLMAAMQGRKDMTANSGANVLGAYATVWKLNQLKELDEALLAALARRATVLAPHTPAAELASTLDAYALLGRRPPDDFLSAAGKRLQEVARGMTAHDVARALNAFAKFDQQPGKALLVELQRRLLDVVEDLGPHDVAAVFSAYAWLQELPIDSVLLLKKLEAKAEHSVEGMAARDISDVIHALATMRVTPTEALLLGLERRALNVTEAMNTQDVANIFGAYAAMGRSPAEPLLGLLERRAEQVGPSMDAESITTVLDAYVTLHEQPGGTLLAVLGKRAEEAAPEMTAHEVARTINAYATLWQKVGHSLLASLTSGSSGHAKAIQLALMEQLGRSLLASLGRRVEEVAPEMSAKHVADTFEAYAKLSEAPGGPVLFALVQRLRKVVGQMSAADVARTIDAYAKLRDLQEKPQGSAPQ